MHIGKIAKIMLLAVVVTAVALSCSLLDYELDFEILSDITDIETIAVGAGIRELARLRRTHGVGRWRKRKRAVPPPARAIAGAPCIIAATSFSSITWMIRLTRRVRWTFPMAPSPRTRRAC